MDGAKSKIIWMIWVSWHIRYGMVISDRFVMVTLKGISCWRYGIRNYDKIMQIWPIISIWRLESCWRWTYPLKEVWWSVNTWGIWNSNTANGAERISVQGLKYADNYRIYQKPVGRRDCFDRLGQGVLVYF